VPDEEPSGRTPGWREVLIVGAIVVVVVLGLAVATSLLPVGLQDVVFHTPLTIVVLVVGTVGLLAWIARRPSPRA
jgi:heme A synthase